MPREHFLGQIIRQLHSINGDGSINEVQTKFLEHIEDLSFTLLPLRFKFRINDEKATTKTVGPDALLGLETGGEGGVYAFIEAKRIKRGSFQPEQLAREYVVLMREAGMKVPLLILILGQVPRIKVKGLDQKQPIKAAISENLKPVLDKVDSPRYDLPELTNRIDRTVAWITWDEIRQIVRQQQRVFNAETPSTQAAIERVANSIIEAIDFHG